MDAALGSGSTGFCGHGQDDDRHAELGLVDLLDELGALDPALEQGVDEDDVGSQLLDRGERLAAVGQDVEELDPRLGVEQTADVLGDLRDILDDQQARLVTGSHPADDTTRVGRGTHPEVRVGGDPAGRPLRQGLMAMRIARSLPGPRDPGRSRRRGARRQTGVLREAAQLVGADQPEPVAADPATRRAALRRLLEDRGRA